MSKSIEAPARAPRKTRAGSADKNPTSEEIQVRAYHLYLERKGAPGDPVEDWVRAERELRATNGSRPAKKERTAKNPPA